MDVTPTKKTPSNRESRALRALIEPCGCPDPCSHDTAVGQPLDQPFSDIDNDSRVRCPKTASMRPTPVSLSVSAIEIDIERERSNEPMVNHGRTKHYVYKMVDSPVGRLKLVATDDGLAAILWENDRPARVRLHIEAEDDAIRLLVEAERQLEEYFAGQRHAFSLTLDPAGTAFQRKVWNALLTIPFGETRSYGQIARQIGNPRRRARGRRGQRQESALDHRAVPSGHRIDGQTHRDSRAGSTSRRVCWRWRERDLTADGGCRAASAAGDSTVADGSDGEHGSRSGRNDRADALATAPAR